MTEADKETEMYRITFQEGNKKALEEILELYNSQSFEDFGNSVYLLAKEDPAKMATIMLLMLDKLNNRKNKYV